MWKGKTPKALRLTNPFGLKPKSTSALRPKYLGFGFSPRESNHHFLVTMPKKILNEKEVVISEHLFWSDPKEKSIQFNYSELKGTIKAFVNLNIWEKIEDCAKSEFNLKLKSSSIPLGTWKKTGPTHLSRTLGKELVLLCWALEDCAEKAIPIARINWLGLAPEERWWLYTMTNAASGDPIKDKNRGWRQAVKYALTDNPVSEQVLESRSICFPKKLKEVRSA